MKVVTNQESSKT